MSTIFSDIYRYQPIVDDAVDPYRPMQFTETVKDAFVLELRQFFNSKEVAGLLRAEIPTIEKFRIADADVGEDSFLQQINVIRQLPDVEQKLPILAITTSTGRSRQLGVGTQYVGVVQESPRLRTNVGPWNIPINAKLAFTTKAGVTQFTFTEAYFADMTSVKPFELIACINAQSSRFEAFLETDNTVTIALKNPELEFMEVVAPQTGDYVATFGETPPSWGYVTVDLNDLSGVSLVGVSTDGTSIFGFTLGQRDDIRNAARPPKHRYQVTKELTVNIDVGSDSDNGRTEVTDLVSYYFDLRLEEKDMSINGNPKLGQYFQIILKNELTLGGEAEIPRPEGDGLNKIYVNRVSIPVVMIDFVDRPAPRVSSLLYKPTLVANGDQ